MAVEITNYKCPCCTAPLHFSGESGKLECDYCESSYTVEEVEALYAEKEAAARAAAEKREQSADDGGWGEDAAHLRVYSCPDCGAELICDETTAATSCPYCGNPTIVPGQFNGVLRPDYVIPFRLEKEAAVAALKAHYKRKILLPRSFRDSNHLEEIKGVYVPFWLYDGVADAKVNYHATRSHSHMEGDYRVTVTEHYDVYREGSVTFERIPADGSSKMPDDYMDSIEPYDYSELKPFSTAYLPGYLADKYDVSAEECAMRADERAGNSAVACMTDTVVGYHTKTIDGQSVFVQRNAAKYALMPVWLLSTRWKGKNFLFAMNGQTGKLVGDLPVSWPKFWAWFAGVAVGVAGLISLFLFM